MSGWRLTVPASRDLDDIYTWVFGLENSGERAAAVISRIERTLDRLAEFPFSGRERSELGPGIRSTVAASYVVFYRIGPDQNVEVLRITGQQDDVLDP